VKAFRDTYTREGNDTEAKGLRTLRLDEESVTECYSTSRLRRKEDRTTSRSPLEGRIGSLMVTYLTAYMPIRLQPAFPIVPCLPTLDALAAISYRGDLVAPADTRSLWRRNVFVIYVTSIIWASQNRSNLVVIEGSSLCIDISTSISIGGNATAR